jgi:hypothetical protein
MSEMIIPKERVSVEICSSQGGLSRGEVFLRPPQEGRGERLLDVLAERWFVPLSTPDNKMVFVATRHIAWVRIDLLAAIDELDPEAEDDASSCVARVVVELMDGTKVEGTMRYVAPHNARRLGDHLERLPQFFALRTDDWLYLISAASVATVTPLEEKR